ncbi:hypothetical protein AXX16_4580 [Serratia rubidaea]|nr:hypothetical protein AXX16_4580 [Serratia rubidaea]
MTVKIEADCLILTTEQQQTAKTKSRKDREYLSGFFIIFYL